MTTHDSRLLVGTGRASITPPVGMHLIGYGLRVDPSTGVHDALTATVLVLGDGTRRMAIAACDVVGFGDADADAIRRDIGAAIGEPPSRVLLATSHTHAGPITGAGFKAFVALDPALDAQEAAYVRVLRDRIVGAAREAVSGLVEGRLAAGTGQAAIAINRRERLPDGRVVIGHNPDGPVDHTVGVARFDDLDGRPLACLVNYACHATVMGPQNLAVSADYPGVARRVVEQNTGARCLFLAGAGANVAALRSICAEFEPMERQGAILGLEAARVFHTLETRPIRRTRAVRQSFGLQVIWEDHVEERPALTRFDARVRRVSLPLRALPALPAAEAELARREDAVRDLDARHVTGVPRMLAERQRRWAVRVVEDVRAGPIEQHVPMELQALRVNELRIVAMPAEPFVEIGLAIRARAGTSPVFPVGYANGYFTYLPWPDAYAEGGYEVDETWKGRLSAGPAPEAAGLVVEACLQLLEETELEPQ